MEEISFKIILGYFRFKIIEKSAKFIRVKIQNEFLIFNDGGKLKCIGFTEEGLTVFSKKTLIFYLSNSYQTDFDFNGDQEISEFLLQGQMTVKEAKLNFLRILNSNEKSADFLDSLDTDFLFNYPFKDSFYLRRNGYNKETMCLLVKDERLKNLIDFDEKNVYNMWVDPDNWLKFEHTKSVENVFCFNPFSFFIYVQGKFVPNHNLYLISNPDNIYLKQSLFQLITEKPKNTDVFIANKNNIWELENMLLVVNNFYQWQDIGIRISFQKSKHHFQLYLEFDRKKVKVSDLSQLKLNIKKSLEKINEDIFGRNQKLFFSSKRLKINLHEFFVFEMPLKNEFISVLVELLFQKLILKGLKLVLLEGTKKLTNEIKAI